MIISKKGSRALAHDVFISYSAKDKPSADAVCATLESRGIRCWIAPRDILPGMDWSSAIVDGISESRLLVLVFSSNSNDSPQIKRELERAVTKGIPIIPFRIENVPLSKPLEYFISTPHWLDALTPPMEKHLNYLADTVLILLQKRSAEQGVPPPIPRPQERDKRLLLWGAIVLALLVLGGGAFLLSRIWAEPKPLPPDPQPFAEKDLRQPENGIEEKESSTPTMPQNEPMIRGEQVDQRSKDAIESDLVGTWYSNPVVDGKPWNLKLRILRSGQFDFTGSTEDSGSYKARAGKWETRTLKGESDSGTYIFLNSDMVTIAGKLGTGVWTRVRKRSASPSDQVDPAMVGAWRTSAVLDNKDFTFLFDIHPAGTFKITSTTTDQGRFEAQNGKFRQISKNGTIIDGTYNMLSPKSVTIIGPAGAGVWTRS